MRRRLLSFVAILGLAVGVFLVRQQAPAAGLPPTGFAVGEAFPTLPLPALADGQPRSLADFRGQKLILHIFASW